MPTGPRQKKKAENRDAPPRQKVLCAELTATWKELYPRVPKPKKHTTGSAVKTAKGYLRNELAYRLGKSTNYIGLIFQGRRPIPDAHDLFEKAGTILDEVCNGILLTPEGTTYARYFVTLLEKEDPPAALDRTCDHACRSVISALQQSARHGNTAFPDTFDKFRSELRSLFVKERVPVAYYYWRQTHEALHWVDFYFLRHLMRLESKPHSSVHLIEPLALISHDETTELDATIRVVGALLGDNFRTLSQVLQNHKTDYDVYAELHAPSEEAPPPLRSEDTQEWLRFMPWFAGVSKSRKGFMLFVWETRRREIDPLYKNTSLNIVEIASGDILLDKALAKAKGPELLVEPEKTYPSICEWVESKPPETALAELINYLMGAEEEETLNAAEFYSVLERKTKVDIALAKALGTHATSEFSRLVNRLAQVLRCWNKRYFSSIADIDS